MEIPFKTKTKAKEVIHAFVNKADQHVSKEQYLFAIENYDSVLVIKSDQIVVKKKEDAQNKLKKINISKSLKCVLISFIKVV